VGEGGACGPSENNFPLELKGHWTIRRVVWGQLDQDGSVRPDLNMVSTGLLCSTNGARNVSLGDVSRAAGHFSGNPWVGNSFPKKIEISSQHPATSFFCQV
jgi:hypothetical protein